MKIERISKEFKQLPKEWVSVFASRVAARNITKLELESETIRTDLQLIIGVIAFEFECCNSHIEFMFQKEEDKFFGIKLKKDIRSETLMLFLAVAEKTIVRELKLLKKNLECRKKNTDYLYQPLYASQNQKWIESGQKFVQALRNLGQGFDIWADWFQGRIDGVPTNEEFLKNVVSLTEEIFEAEPAQINAYLKSLGPDAVALNRIRVIFLGYGAAGKTSLIRALKGLDVVEGKEQMTPGIDISEWQVPGTEIIAHFWDFGGQVVAHATHQFFLRSRCLYVLLLDGRTEINANEQAEYWLEHVRAFGNNAPVMLVGNKADVCAVNLDMAALKEKHPNVKDFYRISCTRCKDEYALDFQRFQNDLSKEAAELGVHTVRFGKAHLAVLDELNSRSSSESFLKKTAGLDLCAASGLAEQGFSCCREWAG
jgi:GTPase SAR1 family protein